MDDEKALHAELVCHIMAAVHRCCAIDPVTGEELATASSPLAGARVYDGSSDPFDIACELLRKFGFLSPITRDGSPLDAMAFSAQWRFEMDIEEARVQLQRPQPDPVRFDAVLACFIEISQYGSDSLQADSEKWFSVPHQYREVVELLRRSIYVAVDRDRAIWMERARPALKLARSGTAYI